MSLVAEYLTRRRVAFEVVPHRRVFTSVEEAVALGVPADEVVKTVALRVHGKYALAVLPASRRLDMHLVRHAVGDPTARLATEAELRVDFLVTSSGRCRRLDRCWDSRCTWLPRCSSRAG